MNRDELPIRMDQRRIAQFCRKWKIHELSLFGSVLRPDFGPESDVDVLVVFNDDASWSYWEWPKMTGELGEIFGRTVDLVEKRAVKNPYRRHAILTTRKVIHAA